MSRSAVPTLSANFALFRDGDEYVAMLLPDGMPIDLAYEHECISGRACTDYVACERLFDEVLKNFREPCDK